MSGHSNRILPTTPPPLTRHRGGANVTRLAMTAKFYTQDAFLTPNPTHPGANVTHLCTSLQRQQEKHHKRAAREARRPLCDPFFFLLSLQ